jgi:hypothetical protein
VFTSFAGHGERLSSDLPRPWLRRLLACQRLPDKQGAYYTATSLEKLEGAEETLAGLLSTFRNAPHMMLTPATMIQAIDYIHRDLELMVALKKTEAAKHG